MSVVRKIIIMIIAVALLGAVVLAVRILTSNKEIGPVSSGTSVNPKQAEFEDAIKKTSVLDQDFDGIPDSEEVKYLTSPTSSDTDGDGLTDFQEIFDFKTDPLKADTDGDNFTDGYEIRRNLNPKEVEKR